MKKLFYNLFQLKRIIEPKRFANQERKETFLSLLSLAEQTRERKFAFFGQKI
jgi:hypothetical protein